MKKFLIFFIIIGSFSYAEDPINSKKFSKSFQTRLAITDMIRTHPFHQSEKKTMDAILEKTKLADLQAIRDKLAATEHCESRSLDCQRTRDLAGRDSTKQGYKVIKAAIDQISGMKIIVDPMSVKDLGVSLFDFDILYEGIHYSVSTYGGNVRLSYLGTEKEIAAEDAVFKELVQSQSKDDIKLKYRRMKQTKIKWKDKKSLIDKNRFLLNYEPGQESYQTSAATISLILFDDMNLHTWRDNIHADREYTKSELSALNSNSILPISEQVLAGKIVRSRLIPATKTQK